MIGLQRLAIPSCPPAKCPPAKRPPFSLDLPAVIVVFIAILPNWGYVRYNKTNISCQCGYPVGMSPLGRMVFPRALPSGKPSSLRETFYQDTHTGMAYLYNIIQICHASEGILMECLPEGGWFSRGRSPR